VPQKKLAFLMPVLSFIPRFLLHPTSPLALQLALKDRNPMLFLFNQQSDIFVHWLAGEAPPLMLKFCILWNMADKKATQPPEG
jgi:hypothetical protein